MELLGCNGMEVGANFGTREEGGAEGVSCNAEEMGLVVFGDMGVDFVKKVGLEGEAIC